MITPKFDPCGAGGVEPQQPKAKPVSISIEIPVLLDAPESIRNRIDIQGLTLEQRKALGWLLGGLTDTAARYRQRRVASPDGRLPVGTQGDATRALLDSIYDACAEAKRPA